MCEDDGILGSDGIKLLAIGEFFLRPEGVVPPTTGDPFTDFVQRNGCGHALLHFFRRRHTCQGDGEFVRGSTTEMHVRVIESRHHKLAFEISVFYVFLAATALEKDVLHPDYTTER